MTGFTVVHQSNTTTANTSLNADQCEDFGPASQLAAPMSPLPHVSVFTPDSQVVLD